MKDPKTIYKALSSQNVLREIFYKVNLLDGASAYDLYKERDGSSYPAVHKHLKKLKDLGAIEPIEKPSEKGCIKKVYKITEDGKKTLKLLGEEILTQLIHVYGKKKIHNIIDKID